MAQDARVRLDYLEMRLKMACSSPFLLLLFDLFSFLLAISLLLILLGVVFNFGYARNCFGREVKEEKEENGFFLVLWVFSLSLWVGRNSKAMWGGGLCFIFLFFYCLASKNQLSINGLSNLVLVVLAKPCVCKWFCWLMKQVGSKNQLFSLSFSFALAGQLKGKWGPLGSIFTT